MKFRHIAIVSAIFVLMTGCSSKPVSETESAIEVGEIMTTPIQTEATVIETQPPTEALPQPTSAHLLAVGDNLIHTCVYRTAENHAENGREYDFHYCYQNVADKVSSADLAFINQETVICNGELEISGANLNFNSPVELGDDLIDVGFDIFNMSNNHVLDKGSEGMKLTLDYWDTQCQKHDNIRVLGAYRNEEDMHNYRISEVNGIKIGFLGYTDHTNGYFLPDDSELQIPYTNQPELMQAQIQELSQQVDCVVVSAHWGDEDTHVVQEEVKELAQNLIDWGADVIIGTGPHTLQTMEYLTRADGSQGFVFYSLGNFISGQTDNFNMVGGMGEWNICKSPEGEITIENVTLTPLITQYSSGMSDVTVYPYYLYTDELVENHFLPYSPMGTAKTWSWDVINTIVYNNVPEEYLLLTPTQDTIPMTTDIFA